MTRSVSTFMTVCLLLGATLVACQKTPNPVLHRVPTTGQPPDDKPAATAEETSPIPSKDGKSLHDAALILNEIDFVRDLVGMATSPDYLSARAKALSSGKTSCLKIDYDDPSQPVNRRNTILTWTNCTIKKGELQLTLSGKQLICFDNSTFCRDQCMPPKELQVESSPYIRICDLNPMQISMSRPKQNSSKMAVSRQLILQPAAASQGEGKAFTYEVTAFNQSESDVRASMQQPRADETLTPKPGGKRGLPSSTTPTVAKQRWKILLSGLEITYRQAGSQDVEDIDGITYWTVTFPNKESRVQLEVDQKAERTVELRSLTKQTLSYELLPACKKWLPKGFLQIRHGLESERVLDIDPSGLKEAGSPFEDLPFRGCGSAEAKPDGTKTNVSGPANASGPEPRK